MSYLLTYLTFTLPRAFGLVPSGRHQPCLHGCVLRVEKSLVRIEGPSRASVIEQALRFVRVHARRGMVCPPIAAVIAGPGGKDRGHIVVGDGAVWSWGGIEPVVGAA